MVTMPPDVFLALASSGISLVAALLFLVAEEPPKVVEGPQVECCLPPPRLNPPPLPIAACTVHQGTHRMTLRPMGNEWIVTLDESHLDDEPVSSVDGSIVHDLRWHQEIGVARRVRVQWKQKPARA